MMSCARFLLRAAGLLLAIQAGLGVAGRSAPAATFKWANDGDVITMDPYTRNEAFLLSFTATIYEPLIRRSRTLGLEPALAVAWEQTSPVIWRFHLRPGVTWQDGSRFAAADVVSSADRVRGPTSVLRSVLGPVKAVRRIDDLTVDVETSAADPLLPQEITTWRGRPG